MIADHLAQRAIGRSLRIKRRLPELIRSARRQARCGEEPMTRGNREKLVDRFVIAPLGLSHRRQQVVNIARGFVTAVVRQMLLDDERRTYPAGDQRGKLFGR